MALAWKFLFPLGLINLFLTAGQLLIWEEPTTAQLWMMGGINWVIALVCLVVSSHLMSDKLTARAPLVPVPDRARDRAQEVR